MPIVRLVSGGEFDDETVSVRLEDKHNLSRIQRVLPELEREMRKKWPALTVVQIHHQLYHRKNPFDPNEVVKHAPAIIAAIFGSKIGVAVLKPPAEEVGEFLRRWVQQFTDARPRKKPSAKRSRTNR